MATLDWPASPAFRPVEVRWGVRSSKSAWQSFYTGQTQSLTHLADRLKCSLHLPPVFQADQAGQREAFFEEVAAAGHWLRMGHFVRPVPNGSLRGTPVVAANSLAGARSIQIQASPGATVVGGDMLGVSGVLVKVAAQGAAADLSGLLTVPLVLPCLVALTAGASVAWLAPKGVFELVQGDRFAAYTLGLVQGPMQIDLLQVLP